MNEKNKKKHGGDVFVFDIEKNNKRAAAFLVHQCPPKTRTEVGYGIRISITVSEKVHQTYQKRKLTPTRGFDDEKRRPMFFSSSFLVLLVPMRRN